MFILLKLAVLMIKRLRSLQHYQTKLSQLQLKTVLKHHASYSLLKKIEPYKMLKRKGLIKYLKSHKKLYELMAFL